MPTAEAVAEAFLRSMVKLSDDLKKCDTAEDDIAAAASNRGTKTNSGNSVIESYEYNDAGKLVPITTGSVDVWPDRMLKDDTIPGTLEMSDDGQRASTLLRGTQAQKDDTGGDMARRTYDTLDAFPESDDGLNPHEDSKDDTNLHKDSCHERYEGSKNDHTRTYQMSGK